MVVVVADVVNVVGLGVVVLVVVVVKELLELAWIVDGGVVVACTKHQAGNTVLKSYRKHDRQ